MGHYDADYEYDEQRKQEVKAKDKENKAAKANERQVGGNHYNKHGDLQHWDLVNIFKWDYFQGQITKYVMRWKDKNGVQDLEKARHFLDKYIEIAKLSVVFKEAMSNEENPSTIVDRISKQMSTINHNELEWVRNVLAEELGYSGPLAEAVCPLREWLQEAKHIKPDGYVGFTYEGGTKDWDLFRCVKCREEIRVIPGSSPWQNHGKCSAEGDATRSYVNQD